jgi:hypothetical protein
VVLSFTEGAPGNNASATKTGNSDHITAPPPVWTTEASKSASPSQSTPPAPSRRLCVNR